MPFLPSNITVSESKEQFAGISYTVPTTKSQNSVSFKPKDVYSHFGVTVGKSPFTKEKTYSLGVQLEKPSQIENFKAVAKRCSELLEIDVALKSLYEKDTHTVIYLKLSKEQASGIPAGKSCISNVVITFASVYLGPSPSLTVRVREIQMKPCEKRSFGENDNYCIDED